MKRRIVLYQSSRRLLVIGFISTFVASLMLRLLADNLDQLALGLQVLGVFFAAGLLRWGKPQIKSKFMDERQRDIRNRSYFRTYLLLSVISVSIPIVMTLLFVVAEQTTRALIVTLLTSLQRPVDFVTVFSSLALFVVFLPWAMLAWLEPDPPRDESVTLKSDSRITNS